MILYLAMCPTHLVEGCRAVRRSELSECYCLHCYRNIEEAECFFLELHASDGDDATKVEEMTPVTHVLVV